ncbi:MAG TPA: ATP-binding protein [Chloroflexia bacterium]
MTSSQPKNSPATQTPWQNHVPADSNGTNTQNEQGQPNARLPWTTSGLSPNTPEMNGQGAPNPPQAYANGHGAQPASTHTAPIFAVNAGPLPEEIPGFPYPEPSRDNLQQVLGSQPQGSNIRPLAAMGAVPLQAQTMNMSQPGAATQPDLGTSPMMTQPQLPVNALNALNGMNGNGNGMSPTGRLTSPMLAGHGVQPNGHYELSDAMFPEPRSIEETGINQGLIADLVIKTMYFTSYMSGQEISAEIRVPFYGVIDQAINLMKKEQLCEVSGTSGLGEAGYQYILTVKGMERAHQVLARSSYVGPCPVPLARYIEALKVQTNRRPVINREVVENGLKGLIISEELLNQLGAAVNAGKSLFLFGAPGNGKTLLTERIATMLGGNLAIPYAIEADGQIIQLFDLNSHRPAVPQGANENDSTRAEFPDRRWVRVHRPVVIVGGELTLPSLDLIYNETAGFYEAPFQLKANGGLFLIDDFGRQQVSPQALLNRWIVPLEKSIDFLTLKTGKKLQVPFELFLVLSTNLQPEDLIDDAFLRRIQNKLNVPDPTPQQFYEIFLAMCKSLNVPFDQHGFTYLVKKHYIEVGRPFRASQPRDLLRQLMGIARYRNVPPEMTPQLVDAACSTYFVNAKPKH